MSGDPDFIMDVMQECLAYPGNNFAAIERVLARYKESRAPQVALDKLRVIQRELAHVERRRRNSLAAIAEAKDECNRRFWQARLPALHNKVEALKEQEREAIKEINRLSK